MKKTHKVVMLPTTKSNNVGDIVMRPSDKRLATINILTKDDPQDCINQHLYILSDEEIKDGDWYYNEKTKMIWKYSKEDNGGIPNCAKKIIATTDKSLSPQAWIRSIGHLSLPSIPESFIQAYIKAYNEGKSIIEVDLEYNSATNQVPNGNTIYWLKIREDNTVIIHKSKMYSKDEVIELLKDLRNELAYIEGYYDDKDLNNWIQDNL